MKQLNFILIYLFLSICFISFLSSEEEILEQTIVLEVQWFPQSQFAGYIMAFEKGFYKDLGLNVQISFSDGTDSPINKILNEEAKFCTAWLSQAIVLKTKGTPIVNISQILQKSSLMLVTKKTSNILRPTDMNGKCISTWGGDFSYQPNAFFNKFDINAKVVPQSFTIDAFLAGACDVCSAMYYNEYHKFIQAGINEDELVPFFYSDFDLNFPEDGLYCTEKTYNSNPELCRKFVQASIAGWEYAFAHPEETLDVVMKYCDEFHLQTNWSHQKWMLKAIETAVKYQVGDDPGNWGKLRKDDFLRVAYELKEQGFIDEIPSFDNFFKGDKK